MVAMRGWTRRETLGRISSGLAAASMFAPLARADAGAEIRVACIGDSMIDGVWGGLLRLVTKEPCLKSRMNLGRFGENGTGLTRSDRYNWAEEAAKIVAEFKPNLVLVSLGLNDRQGVVDAKTKARTVFGDPGWNAAYEAAVTDFLRSASATKAGLLWLGIPAMRDAVAQADAKEKNRIYSHIISGLGDKKVVFVDPWRQAGANDDAFTAYGSDANGSKIQLRTPDGIHFTAAGYDLIAAYLLPKIIVQLKASGADLAYPCP